MREGLKEQLPSGSLLRRYPDPKKAFSSHRKGRSSSAENSAGSTAILSIGMLPRMERFTLVTEKESRMTAGEADIIIRPTKIFQQRFTSMAGKISGMKCWRTIFIWRKRRFWNAA